MIQAFCAYLSCVWIVLNVCIIIEFCFPVFYVLLHNSQQHNLWKSIWSLFANVIQRTSLRYPKSLILRYLYLLAFLMYSFFYGFVKNDKVVNKSKPINKLVHIFRDEYKDLRVVWLKQDIDQIVYTWRLWYRGNYYSRTCLDDYSVIKRISSAIHQRILTYTSN